MRTLELRLVHCDRTGNVRYYFLVHFLLAIVAHTLQFLRYAEVESQSIINDEQEVSTRH
jgi:hypothetical protein